MDVPTLCERVSTSSGLNIRMFGHCVLTNFHYQDYNTEMKTVTNLTTQHGHAEHLQLKDTQACMTEGLETFHKTLRTRHRTQKVFVD